MVECLAFSRRPSGIIFGSFNFISQLGIFRNRHNDGFTRSKLYSLNQIRLHQLPEMITRRVNWLLSSLSQLLHLPKEADIFAFQISSPKFSRLLQICVSVRYASKGYCRKSIAGERCPRYIPGRDQLGVHCQNQAHQEMLPLLLPDVKVYARKRQRKRHVHNREVNPRCMF